MGLAVCAGCQPTEMMRLEGLSSDTDLPDELREAKDRLALSKPVEAGKILQTWIKANPDSPVTDQALYLKGQALFDQKRYHAAAEAYEKLADEHGSSNRFSDALQRQVEIARMFLSGTRRKVGPISFSGTSDAMEILDRVALHWPGSELAVEALILQAGYFYSKGDFLEAQQTYQMVVENYQSSRYYEQALLGYAEATYFQYDGPRYDSQSLQEAEVRYRQFRAEFPESIHDDEIVDRLRRLRDLQAEKEFEIASFYHRTGKHPAAQYYWQTITETWPTSDWARQSEAMLQKFQ